MEENKKKDFALVGQIKRPIISTFLFVYYFTNPMRFSYVPGKNINTITIASNMIKINLKIKLLFDIASKPTTATNKSEP